VRWPVGGGRVRADLSTSGIEVNDFRWITHRKSLPGSLTLIYFLCMDASQCRAARGLLCWSQEELAHHASVGLSTVRVFEHGGPIRPGNVLTIAEALEAEGVEFVPRGVRWRSKRRKRRR
jgi:hypothetical protein